MQTNVTLAVKKLKTLKSFYACYLRSLSAMPVRTLSLVYCDRKSKDDRQLGHEAARLFAAGRIAPVDAQKVEYGGEDQKCRAVKQEFAAPLFPLITRASCADFHLG